MYFYKAFYKDHTAEYIATPYPIRSPKIVDPNCIKLERVGFLRGLFGYYFKSRS